jgi:hypothetical protein
MLRMDENGVKIKKHEAIDESNVTSSNLTNALMRYEKCVTLYHSRGLPAALFDRIKNDRKNERIS